MGKGNKPTKNDKKDKKPKGAKALGVKKLPLSTKTNFGSDSSSGGSY